MVRQLLALSGVATMIVALATGVSQAQGRSMQNATQNRTRSTVAKPAKATAASPVNLNTASTDDLRTLPNVGAATAARIIEYRQKNGGFKKIEDVMNVKGIGEKSFLKLKPLITVAATKPSER
jgi:competence protein ComEA